MKNTILLAAMLIATNGCANTSTDSDAVKLYPPKELPDTERCLAANPQNVQAWINAMPGIDSGNRPPLHLNFKATTPTPGYQFALEVSQVMESFPEQVVLELIVKRPDGMVTQVVSESNVKLKLNNFPGSDGSSIQVNCEGKPFFTIDKVTTFY